MSDNKGVVRTSTRLWAVTAAAGLPGPAGLPQPEASPAAWVHIVRDTLPCMSAHLNDARTRGCKAMASTALKHGKEAHDLPPRSQEFVDGQRALSIAAPQATHLYDGPLA